MIPNRHFLDGIPCPDETTIFGLAVPFVARPTDCNALLPIESVPEARKYILQAIDLPKCHADASGSKSQFSKAILQVTNTLGSPAPSARPRFDAHVPPPATSAV